MQLFKLGRKNIKIFNLFYLIFLGCTVADLESRKDELDRDKARFSLLKYEFFEDLKSFKLSIYSFISLSILIPKFK